MNFHKVQIKNDLLIIIEAADMLVPEEKMSSMSMADRKRVAILHDWFSDPDFMDGPGGVGKTGI